MNAPSPTANGSVPPGTFVHPIVPRFYEIDGQGVMFNMWYLAYVDQAVIGFFVDRGLPYADWPSLGVDVHVAHVDLDWAAPITAADAPEVLMNTGRVGTKSFTLDFVFRRDGVVSCTGGIVYVAVATDGSGTVPLPAPLVEALGEAAPLRAR